MPPSTVQRRRPVPRMPGRGHRPQRAGLCQDRPAQCRFLPVTPPHARGPAAARAAVPAGQGRLFAYYLALLPINNAVPLATVAVSQSRGLAGTNPYAVRLLARLLRRGPGQFPVRLTTPWAIRPRCTGSRSAPASSSPPGMSCTAVARPPPAPATTATPAVAGKPAGPTGTGTRGPRPARTRARQSHHRGVRAPGCRLPLPVLPTNARLVPVGRGAPPRILVLRIHGLIYDRAVSST